MSAAETWTPEAVQQLRDLWARGHSANAIARSINETFPGAELTKNAVIGKARRLGLVARPSPIRAPVAETPADVVAKAATMRGNGLSIKRIAKTLKISPKRVNAATGRNLVKRAEPETLPLFPPGFWMDLAPRPVVAPVPAPVTNVVQFPAVGRCCWLDGESPKTFRQCEAMAVRNGRPPYSYCEEHRRIAYVSRQQGAVA